MLRARGGSTAPAQSGKTARGDKYLRLPQTSQPPPISATPATRNTPTCWARRKRSRASQQRSSTSRTGYPLPPRGAQRERSQPWQAAHTDCRSTSTSLLAGKVPHDCAAGSGSVLFAGGPDAVPLCGSSNDTPDGDVSLMSCQIARIGRLIFMVDLKTKTLERSELAQLTVLVASHDGGRGGRGGACDGEGGPHRGAGDGPQG